MRIAAFHARALGPLGNARHEAFHMDFTDGDSPGERVLISGMSGSGKTTALRAMAKLWGALGALLCGEVPKLPEGIGCAIQLTGLVECGPVLVASGSSDWHETLARENADMPILGFITGESAPVRVWPEGDAARELRALMRAWRAGDGHMPNMVLYDDEYPPTFSPELPRGFLITGGEYTAWAVGHPDAALGRVGERGSAQLDDLMGALNQIFIGKRIVRSGEDVQVNTDAGAVHGLNALSRGERAALALLYIVAEGLREGGVMLMDHPDQQVHPERLGALMSAVERIVRARKGQLILTSHRPEAWERYGRVGVHIPMEGML